MSEPMFESTTNIRCRPFSSPSEEGLFLFETSPGPKCQKSSMTESTSGNQDLPVIESCDGCGVCCMQTVAPPFTLRDGVHEAEIRQVPQHLIDEIMPTWELRFQLTERPCLWFDETTRSCRHYEFRPQACRDFELDSTICHLIRDRWGLSN